MKSNIEVANACFLGTTHFIEVFTVIVKFRKPKYPSVGTVAVEKGI